MKEKIFPLLVNDWQRVFDNIQNQKSHGNNISGICPFHDDTNSSFSFNITTLQYNCFACDAKGDVWHYLQWKEKRNFKEILSAYANHYNLKKTIHLSKKKKIINLDVSLIDELHKNVFINKTVKEFLSNKRGLTEETINFFKIGWDNKKQRNSIPIFDKNGKPLNIKYHNSKKKLKSFSEVTNLGVQLFNLHHMLLSQDDQVIICEGEFDCMLLTQLGFVAVSSTNGCQSFKKDWLQYFENKNIILLYDVDPPGQKAVTNNLLPLFEKGPQLSIKNIKLPLSGTKISKDFTDYIVNSNGTATDLIKLIESTPAHNYDFAINDTEVIELASFALIEKEKYVDKKVICDITVCGETSESYHVPIKFKVKFCRSRDVKDECPNCIGELKLSPSANEFIGSCGSNDSQVIAMLQKATCYKNEKPTIEITSKVTVKEFFCSQKLNSSIDDEPIEKKVFLLSSKTVKPGNYRATGWIKTNPKNQTITFLIKKLVSQDDDFQKFKIEENTHHLKLFKELGFFAVIEDLTTHVTNIYKMDELLISMLLTYTSPLDLHFNGEDIRGWINTFIVGDSSTGKSQTYKRLINFTGIGDVFQGTTGSRTGLVYAVQANKNNEWQIKIGKHPANDKKLLIIDEANMVPSEEMRTLSAGMDEGYIEVNKVVSRKYKSRTRLIIISNSKKDQTMDNYTFGCTAIKGLVSAPFIRRIDIGIFLNRDHVAAKGYINKINDSNTTKQIISAEMLRAVIFWAWNLKKEQISFSKEATNKILKSSENILIPAYGHADDIPLVDRSDCRKTLARIASAFAILFISTTDYKTVVIEEEHVKAAVSFLNAIYNSDSCQLNRYSDIKKKGSQINDDEFKKLEEMFIKKSKDTSWDREDPPDSAKVASLSNFVLVISQLYRNDSITRNDLQIFSGVPIRSIDRILNQLRQQELIATKSRGYYKKPKLIKFLNKFLSKHPNYLEIS